MLLKLEIKVIPNAGKNCCMRDKNGQIKWYLTSAPEKGRANRELIKSIAKKLNIPQQSVDIIAGALARKKTVSIDVAYDMPTLLTLLGVADKQQSFL